MFKFKRRFGEYLKLFNVNLDIFQFEDLSKKMASSTETIEVSRSELTDLKRRLQALQIELQSQLSLVIHNTRRSNKNNPIINHLTCPLPFLTTPDIISNVQKQAVSPQ